LSLVEGISILTDQWLPELPYAAKVPDTKGPIRKVMVNAAGFGGNAGSIIISRPFD